MFSKIKGFLSGKRTYIVVFISVGLAVAQSQGWYTVPEWGWALAGALGLGFLRASVNGIANSIPTTQNSTESK